MAFSCLKVLAVLAALADGRIRASHHRFLVKLYLDRIDAARCV
jgi:hypothetical protein